MSVISGQRLRECQGFIDKVGEIRFTKVRKRWLNKYNMLQNKKEGNITNNLASQASRQASAYLSPGKAAIHLKQAGRHSPSLWGKKQLIPG